VAEDHSAGHPDPEVLGVKPMGKNLPKETVSSPKKVKHHKQTKLKTKRQSK
jgi:hypothetical protein